MYYCLPSFSLAKLGNDDAQGRLALDVADILVANLHLDGAERDEAAANIAYKLWRDIKRHGLVAFQDEGHFVAHYQRHRRMLLSMAFPTKASRPLWQSLPRTTLSLSPDSTGERIDVPDNGIDALTRLEVCEQANLLSQHCRSLSERDQALINSVLDHIPIVDWSRIAESLDIATADAARSRWFRIRQSLRRLTEEN